MAIRFWLLATLATLAGTLSAEDNANANPKGTGSLTEILKTELNNNLDSIRHTFHVKYAPKEWKLQLTGWDLDSQIATAKTKASHADSLSLQDCRHILMTFFHSCSDYHVSAKFHSTAFSYLPFRIKSSQGRYFVSWVDKNLLWDRDALLIVGDEVLSFDGKPIDEVVKVLHDNHFNRGMPLTDHALAEISLTLRMGSEGLIPQKGTALIEIQRLGTIFNTFQEWIYGPEEVPLPFAGIPKSIGKPKEYAQTHSDLLTLLHRPLKTPLSDAFADVYRRIKSLKPEHDDIIDDEFFAIGAKKSFVPILGKVVWRLPAIKNFHAYIYEHPSNKRRIGYVRIPHFDVSDGHAAKEFATLIKNFEASTDALVIDQVCNPGGDLFYVYTLASIFATKPLTVPAHRFTITQEDVWQALNFLNLLQDIDSDDAAQEYFGSTISGYRIDMSFVAKVSTHFQFILDQWEAGNILTEPFHLYGINELKPYRSAKYSKPILMLINPLDFSGGDFLPAILQDNARVTLFGSRTAGAGGYVEKYSHPNFFGLNYYSCTASIAERIGRVPLENLGVIPDILYYETPNDLQYGYKEYAAAINKAIGTLSSHMQY